MIKSVKLKFSRFRCVFVNQKDDVHLMKVAYSGNRGHEGQKSLLGKSEECFRRKPRIFPRNKVEEFKGKTEGVKQNI